MKQGAGASIEVIDMEKPGYSYKTARKSLTFFDDSGDEEDPDYAKKAKKFREKCKKKYVVSTGKNKKKLHAKAIQDVKNKFACKKDRPKCSDSNVVGKSKLKAGHSPRKVLGSPKSPKKLSPKKSPKSSNLIILSESDSEEIEELDVAGLKRKIKEKEDEQWKYVYSIQSDPVVVMDKLDIKLENLVEADNKCNDSAESKAIHGVSELHDDSGELDKDQDDIGKEDGVKKEQSVEENKSEDNGSKSLNTDKMDEAGSHTQENDVKKRVPFVTLDSETDAGSNPKFSDKSPAIINSDVKKVKHSGPREDNAKKNSSEAGMKHVDDKSEEPKASSSSQSDNSGPKKGSAKQIRRLEALLEV